MLAAVAERSAKAAGRPPHEPQFKRVCVPSNEQAIPVPPNSSASNNAMIKVLEAEAMGCHDVTQWG